MTRTSSALAAILVAVTGLASWRFFHARSGASTSNDASSPAPTAPGWRPTFERAKDDVTRARAFELAAGEPTTESVEWLAHIADTDPRLGARAAASLGTVKSPAMCETLVRLSGNASILSRSNAIRAVGNSGGCNYSRSLATLVGNVQEPLRIRQEAATALAKIADPSVVATLADAMAALRSEGGPEAEQLRIAVIQTLGAIGSPDATKVLTNHARGVLSTVERAFVAKYVGVAG
jgi:HEAT repeat protein